MRRIRAGIVYGEIAPGTIHSAPALAARLGVSVTPVREALIALSYRGMVTQVRNRGFRVVEHSHTELDAALELRLLLELPMLTRFASGFDPAEAPQLRALVDDGLQAARARRRRPAGRARSSTTACRPRARRTSAGSSTSIGAFTSGCSRSPATRASSRSSIRCSTSCAWVRFASRATERRS